MNDRTTQTERNRPEDRFAGPQHRFDLDVVANGLRQEVRPGVAGHRQEALYKHGQTTLALFLFSAGSRLAPHRTKGTVIIQIVKGRMTVTAEGTPHELRAGSVLVLAAREEHEVIATEDSEMLLTVHLDPPAGPAA